MDIVLDERMVRRATRLAAVQILYGQQFHGETIQQIDPILEEEEDTRFKSDRVFLARLLSCARTNRRPLQDWLATKVTRRSWGNVDLLLRLILWLAASEMLLERVGGKGSVNAIGLDVSKLDESLEEKVVDKPPNIKVVKKLGTLAGEYCGTASLFYEDHGTLGFVNGILDGVASCDLVAIVEEWMDAARREKELQMEEKNKKDEEMRIKVEKEERLKKEIVEQAIIKGYIDLARGKIKVDSGDKVRRYGYGVEDVYDSRTDEDRRREDEDHH